MRQCPNVAQSLGHLLRDYLINRSRLQGCDLPHTDEHDDHDPNDPSQSHEGHSHGGSHEGHSHGGKQPLIPRPISIIVSD